MSQRVPRLGVVLSGGGAGGAFQAGLLTALAEARIPISGYAGSSIGAFNAALAASGEIHLLRRFWLSPPAVLRREPRIALRQDLAVLVEFIAQLAQDPFFRATFRSYVRDPTIGAVLCGLVGAGVGYVVAGPGGVKTGAEWGAAIGAIGGVTHGHRSWKRYLFEECRDKAPTINRRLRDWEQSGRFVKQGVVSTFERRLDGLRPRIPVHITLAECRGFRARHLWRMYESKTVEVISDGGYFLAEQTNIADLALASMSIPLLFPRRKLYGRRTWFDGGLYDNLPIDAFGDDITAGDVDRLLVVDVSSTASKLRQRISAAPVFESFPVLYVTPGHRRNNSPVRQVSRIVDFSQTQHSFADGYRAGNLVLRRWLLSRRFDPARDLDRGATLPPAHIIRAHTP